MVVAHTLQEGQTDFWFDQNLLGYPLFLAYQPLPSLLMGTVVAVTEAFVSPIFLYKLSIVLIWGTMPVFWYLGGRWLGLERTTALFFGLLVLMVRDVWNFGLGFNSTARYGLYTQAWSTAAFPLALGSIYRFLFSRDIKAIIPIGFLSLTFLCHLISGYLCIVASIGLLLTRRHGMLHRALRLAAVSFASLVLIGFWLLPFLLNSRYQGGFPYRWETSDGYPLSETLIRIVRGELLDANRFPWLTLLAAVGLIGLIKQWRDIPTRWMCSFGALCFLFWLGPTTWGSWYRKLPLHGELQVVRYTMGLQFAAMFFAASGLRTLLLLLHSSILTLEKRQWRLVNTKILSVGVTALTTLLLWNWLIIASGALKTFDHNSQGFTELAQILSRGKGRFLCHERLDTADQFHYNLLPLLVGRPHVRTYGRGYHDTLSLYYLDHVQFSASDFRMYNIRHLVAKGDPPLDNKNLLKLLWSNETYRVYEVSQPTGYFEFTRIPISAHAGNMKALRELLLEIDPVLLEMGALPSIGTGPSTARDRIEVVEPNHFTMVVNGKPLAENVPTSMIKYEMLRRYSSFPPIRSSVAKESSTLNEYRASVIALDEEATLVLKASYHPYWHASVDDSPVQVFHIAPNLMGVDVPAGNHDVRFRFQNPPYQKLWFVLSVLAWIACFVGSYVAPHSFRKLSNRPGPGGTS